MIKGINKNAIIVKNLKNEIFEEAIFIVKPKKRRPRKSVLLREAKKIIEENSDAFISEKTYKNGQ